MVMLNLLIMLKRWLLQGEHFVIILGYLSCLLIDQGSVVASPTYFLHLLNPFESNELAHKKDARLIWVNRVH